VNIYFKGIKIIIKVKIFKFFLGIIASVLSINISRQSKINSLILKKTLPYKDLKKTFLAQLFKFYILLSLAPYNIQTRFRVKQKEDAH
jgi:hypothetical protein